MQPFEYHNPTRIVFGEGVLERIGEETARLGKRVLLVTGGGSVHNSGVYETVLVALAEAGLEIVEFSGVRPNPVLSHLREGIAFAKTSNVEVVVALGGGSVMDEAKGIAAGARMDADIAEFLTGKTPLTHALPLIAVPTVAATGSEMNGVFVITDDQTQFKNGAAHDLCRPVVSLMDPATTRTLPLEYTALAAVDIISHSTEGYLTQRDPATPLQDGLVHTIVSTVMHCMGTLMADPKDSTARANMMWASTLAWNGLCPAGIGPWAKPCHMLGHPISGLYDTAHGASLSIVTPAWMRFQARQDPTRIAAFGRAVLGVLPADDTEAALTTAIALTDWYTTIGAPCTMAQAGIDDPDHEALASRSLDIARAKGSAGQWTMENLTDIFRACT